MGGLFAARVLCDENQRYATHRNSHSRDTRKYAAIWDMGLDDTYGIGVAPADEVFKCHTIHVFSDSQPSML